MRCILRGRDKSAVGARGARAKRRPPLGGPLGEQSRCNHDAIMIRLMSHHKPSNMHISGRVQIGYKGGDGGGEGGGGDGGGEGGGGDGDGTG